MRGDFFQYLAHTIWKTASFFKRNSGDCSLWKPNRRSRVEMSQNPTMYGRKYELTWLNAKLFPKKNTFSVPPLVLLHGPKGRGKTLLAREVVQLHREGSGNLRLIVFSVNAENAGGGLPEFSQALMQSGETVFSNLQSDLSKLKSEFNAEFLNGRGSDWRRRRLTTMMER